jgi:hypothetical protein
MRNQEVSPRSRNQGGAAKVARPGALVSALLGESSSGMSGVFDGAVPTSSSRRGTGSAAPGFTGAEQIVGALGNHRPDGVKRPEQGGTTIAAMFALDRRFACEDG